MSLCINPHCQQPDHPRNDGSRYCQSCGSDLVLQDRYRVLRLISDKSGFGIVYEAFERSIPKILKVLKDVHSRNEKAVELFQQEANVLSQLHHPGIPAIEPQGYFQFIPRDGNVLHCLIMEKIDGPNLREWMRQQGNYPITEKQALRWLDQLTDILHQVHQKNYFHRDIKPENIMLRSNGQLVLVDFGAAREMTYTYLAQLGGGSSGVTRISSAGYTPPEQEYGQAVPQSDFYALGRTFIYLLTGKLPTDGEIYNPLENEFRWREFAPHLSPGFADFIDRLVATKVSNRPHSTQAIKEEIARLMEQPSSSQLPFASATVVKPITVQQPGQPRRSPHRWLVGGATLLVTLAGLGGWYIYRSSAGKPAEPIQVVETLEGTTGLLRSMVLDSGRSLLIGGSVDGSICVWNLSGRTSNCDISGHQGPVNAMLLSSNGTVLVSGGADKTIRFWELGTGKLLKSLNAAGFVNGLALSPNGTLLAAAIADGSIQLLNFPDGTELGSLLGHQGPVNDLVFNHDGTLISGGVDGTVRIWDVNGRSLQKTLPTEQGFVNTVAVSNNGEIVISGGTEQTIRLWQTSTGQPIHTFQDSSTVNDLLISPNDKLLLSGNADGELKMWDLVRQRPYRTLTGYGNPLDFFAVDFNENLVYSGSKSADVRVWSMQGQP